MRSIWRWVSPRHYSVDPVVYATLFGEPRLNPPRRVFVFARKTFWLISPGRFGCYHIFSLKTWKENEDEFVPHTTVSSDAHMYVPKVAETSPNKHFWFGSVCYRLSSRGSSPPTCFLIPCTTYDSPLLRLFSGEQRCLVFSGLC